MKSIGNLTLFALGLAILTPVASLGFQEAAKGATDRNTFIVDVAPDCRTVVNEPSRAGVSYVSGKIFPAGTLPSGAATNDPAKPVNGIAPIGDWTVRGQNNVPFPPEVAAAYASQPTFFATAHFIFNGGRNALTTEGYGVWEGSAPVEAHSAVTGGIGAFRGASGDLEGSFTLGTNATGCPNYRIRFNFVPGSVRGASNNQ
jgi:hypothetical protein